jgi:hypothetical protein
MLFQWSIRKITYVPGIKEYAGVGIQKNSQMESTY